MSGWVIAGNPQYSPVVPAQIQTEGGRRTKGGCTGCHLLSLESEICPVVGWIFWGTGSLLARAGWDAEDQGRILHIACCWQMMFAKNIQKTNQQIICFANSPAKIAVCAKQGGYGVQLVSGERQWRNFLWRNWEKFQVPIVQAWVHFRVLMQTMWLMQMTKESAIWLIAVLA